MASEFVLKLDPADRILFSSKKVSLSDVVINLPDFQLGEEHVSMQLKVSNPTSDNYAFKVKCTSNEMFRIRPPVGLAEAGKDASVTVGFCSGPF